MIILSVSKLNNLQVAGTNINIPKFVKYLNNECDSGYLDLGNENLKNFEGFKNYFKIGDLREGKISELPSPFNNPDLVVFQGFYKPEFLKIYKELNNRKIPYTIVPRCSLTKEAQKIKPLKKIIGNILYFNKMVKNAKFIHFLTQNEFEESKKAFRFQDHIIVGNGTELPINKYVVKNREEFNITFVGRYNIFHKGLDVLLETVKSNKVFFENNKIKFIFYGADSDGGLSYLNEFIRNNELQKIIKINGPIFGKEKEQALLDSDVFIHTSRLEGHPTSVIEAISYGIPVIVTPGTNVSDDVENNDLGFVCNLNKESILKAIKTAYGEKDKFKKISENEIKYAQKNFDWNVIAREIIKEYSKKLEKENL